jgi:hypothetical protein
MRYLAASLLWLLAAVSVVAFVRVTPRGMEEQQLGVLARDFKGRLGISASIPVAIIDKNERLASVRAIPGRNETYLLEVDATFLASLTQEERRAIVAHEVGHVWIFSHHPFLQSETLANEVAERLVPQESLVKVYKKVWALGGQGSTLAGFLALKLGGDTTDSGGATIPALQQRTVDKKDVR